MAITKKIKKQSPSKDDPHPISFTFNSVTEIFIYDVEEEGEYAQDGLMGSIEISDIGDEIYPLYGLRAVFTEENLEKILKFGKEYTKKFKLAQKKLTTIEE